MKPLKRNKILITWDYMTLEPWILNGEKISRLFTNKAGVTEHAYKTSLTQNRKQWPKKPLPKQNTHKNHVYPPIDKITNHFFLGGWGGRDYGDQYKSNKWILH